MQAWLDKLFSDRLFMSVGAPLLFLALSSYLIVGFIKDRRRIKRGEPLKVWYLRYPVYPDDISYRYFAFQRLLPAIGLFIVLGIVALLTLALIGYAVFFGPLSAPQP